MIISYIKLSAAALMPAVLTLILTILKKRNVFERMTYLTEQCLYGVLFGALAVMGTEWGIPMNGAQANCRDAAVLTAGLVFGAPAGIIAGFIGGIERWFAVYWGVGTLTRTACTVSTILAGFYAAYLRRRLFQNERTGSLISFAVGVVMEIFHLIMVFITNMNDPETALTVVRACTIPMVVSNGFSVMLATLIHRVLSGERAILKREKSGLSETVQRRLLITIACIFVLSTVFVVRLQDKIAMLQTDEALKRSNDEIVNDIGDTADADMIAIAHLVGKEAGTKDLKKLAQKYGLTEISIVDINGIITESSDPKYVGFDMNSGRQASEFLCLLTDKMEFAQDYGPISSDSKDYRKYAGVRTGSGFIQVGYDADGFQAEIESMVKDISKNRHVGRGGCVVVLNARDEIVSAPEEFAIDDVTGIFKMPPDTMFRMEFDGIDCYCRYVSSEAYTILSLYPVDEAMLMRTVAVYVNTFLEILVFALLFALVYMLIRRLVVDQIKSVNQSLARITGGDLDEVVSVRSNKEFASLSDDINSTVSTLKNYITEASARIDRELEAARGIQRAALPDVSPNFSNRSDIDMNAYMATAKEVGGDFYDFYMTDPDTLNLLIADVSGKGIPAAMFMMRAKTELKNLTESGLPLDEVFVRGNNDLCSENDSGMFVTAWQGSLNLKTGKLKYVNAGHNLPLIKRGNGAFEMMSMKPNFILGGMEDVRYEVRELTLQKGDTLLLYTDGVTEATDANEKLFGEERLLNVANEKDYDSADSLIDAVMEAIRSFTGEAPQFDDITMLSVTYKGREKDPKFAFTEASLEDIPILTEQVDTILMRLDVPPKIAVQMDVAIDEVYSNIVKYAYPGHKGPASVTVHGEADRISLTFEDEGTPYNPLTNAEPDVTLSAEERKIGGLGIYIVKKTMDEVYYAYENNRNIFIITKYLKG